MNKIICQNCFISLYDKKSNFSYSCKKCQRNYCLDCKNKIEVSINQPFKKNILEYCHICKNDTLINEEKNHIFDKSYYDSYKHYQNLFSMNNLFKNNIQLFNNNTMHYSSNYKNNTLYKLLDENNNNFDSEAQSGEDFFNSSITQSFNKFSTIHNDNFHINNNNKDYYDNDHMNIMIKKMLMFV
jgi:hypothetical protein